MLQIRTRGAKRRSADAVPDALSVPEDTPEPVARFVTQLEGVMSAVFTQNGFDASPVNAALYASCQAVIFQRGFEQQVELLRLREYVRRAVLDPRGLTFIDKDYHRCILLFHF